MIWNLELMGQVSRLFADMEITNELLVRRGDDVREAARQHCAMVVCDAAHALGVDVHPDDVRLWSRRPDEGHKARNITPHRASWRPATTEVETFHHGEHDGRVMHIERVGDPLRLPMRESVSYIAYDDPTPISGAIPIVEFRLSGWNDGKRRWVYSPDD